MQRQIEQTLQRTRRYWYEDGLIEIAVGCLFVVVGLLFLVEAISPPDSLPPSFSAVGLIVVVTGGLWLARRLVAAAKASLTYPRTGYVAYRRPTTMQRILVSTVASCLAALAVLVSQFAVTPLSWIPAGIGLLIGVALLYLGYTLGLVRFYALAIVSVLVGLGASTSGLDTPLAEAGYFLATGLAIIVSGALALRSYLKQRPRIPEE